MSEIRQTIADTSGGREGNALVNNPRIIEGKATGKRPARSDPRTLLFSRFFQLDKVPKSYNPWKKRRPFPPRTYGNRNVGCCTIASQANHAIRFERIETGRTDRITDAEVLRVYYALTDRLYGGGDVGAYELDALSNWRRPELTFSDDAGHPLTIDAYTRVNHIDLDEVRAAIALSGKYGMKACFSLPRSLFRKDPPAVWDLPVDADGKPMPLVGDDEPGSGGGHSTYVDSYDAIGPRIVHTWYEGDGLPKEAWPVDEQTITWRAFAAYADEAYFILDSADLWKKKPLPKTAAADVAGIIKAVNKVSSRKVGGKSRKAA